MAKEASYLQLPKTWCKLECYICDFEPLPTPPVQWQSPTWGMQGVCVWRYIGIEGLVLKAYIAEPCHGGPCQNSLEGTMSLWV